MVSQSLGTLELPVSFLQLPLRSRVDRDDSTSQWFERRAREAVPSHQMTHRTVAWKVLDRIAKIVVGVLLAC